MHNKIDPKETRRFDSAPSQAAETEQLRPNTVAQNVAASAIYRAMAPKGVDCSAAGQIPFATEAGHWYLPDGTPYYTVPNKSKPGKSRPVTLTDARKAGAVPSVTGITKILHSEALLQYHRKQMFEATLECPNPLHFHNADGTTRRETPEAHMARALAMSKRHAEKAADRGGSLHGDIEKFLQATGEPCSPKWIPHIDKLFNTLKLHGVDLHDGSPEKSFAHPLGFGGKCDWHNLGKPPQICTSNAGEWVSEGKYEPVLIDFKSKPSIEPGKTYAYDEHAMQIASYAVGLGLSLRTVRGINVFIGEQDQRILVHEWPTPDLESAWEQFKHLLAVWQIRKKYCPAFGPEEA